MKGKFFLLVVLVLGQLTAADGWSVYEDKTYNFSIKYPSDWVMTTDVQINEPMKLVVAFTEKVTTRKRYVSNLLVFYWDIGYNISVQTLAELQIPSIRSQFPDVEILSRGKVMGTNAEGYALTIKASNNNMIIKQIQVYFLRKDKVLIIALTSVESEFPKYEPIFKEVIKSFTLLPSEKEMNELFSEAVSLYNKGDFSGAMSKFYEAKRGYQQLKKSSRVAECNSYIEKSSTGIQAKQLEDQANALHNQHKYEEAKAKFAEAKTAYEKIGFSTRVESMNYWISLCEEKIEKELERQKLKTEADTLFFEAKSLFESKKYEEAKAKFAEAKTKYEELADSEKKKECEDWIKKCEEVGIGIIASIIALLLVALFSKRNKISHLP